MQTDPTEIGVFIVIGIAAGLLSNYISRKTGRTRRRTWRSSLPYMVVALVIVAIGIYLLVTPGN